MVTGYPEGYDPTKSGPSGNMTINGTSTYTGEASIVSVPTRKRSFIPGAALSSGSLGKRQQGASVAQLDAPPYAIHNGNFHLSPSHGWSDAEEMQVPDR